MSVKKDSSGRRSIQVEAEVPGTPEEVWRAIATGPGVSAWFVPCEVVEEGGKPVAMKLNFGPGMESLAKLTKWDPPRMLAAESHGLGPTAPPMATEWHVEARTGGTCVVRVVHSLFASTDDWDNQLEGMEHGWPGFFRILKVYLTHFKGQPCSLIQIMAPVAGTEAEAWQKLTAALNLQGAKVGQRWRSPDATPQLGGVVEQTGPHNALLRLDAPTSGTAALSALNCGGPIMVLLSFYLYGDQAKAVAGREEAVWQGWAKDTLA